MADDALVRVTDLLDLQNGHSLPAELRSSLSLAVAKALIGRGELDRAADLLEGIVPSDSDERRQVAAHRVAIARKRAERLQRLKDWPAAAGAWRAVTDLSATDSNAYLNLARALEQQGDCAQAVETCLRLVEAVPSARTYLTVAPRLDQLIAELPPVPQAHRIRIALLGNATLDQLSSYLSVECRRAGLEPTIYLAGFDQVVQETLNPASNLYAFEPDIVIYAMHASRIFPRIHHHPFDIPAAERRGEVEKGLATIQQLLDAFTQRSAATVLIHNMVAPQHPALGIADSREDLGQIELFGDINRRLAELCRTRYRTAYVVDEERLQAQTGKAQATDSRLWLTARVPWSDSMHLALAREYVRYMRALRGMTRKCIVLDLDNTLWGGVVGEDGVDGIQLGADAPGNAFVAFQRELERLWRRGVLLAIASKNNYADVAPVFEGHPAMVLRWSHVAAQRINWSPKAANLRELASELNIGLDSLVFLDDNPVERAAVRAEVPEVLVPDLPRDPALYRAALLELDVFESLGLTAEDRNRGKLYAEQAERRAFEASAQDGSLEDYLERLDIVVEFAPVDARTLTRVAQLTNKTNQFNMTTRRYTEGEILAMQAAGHDVVAMRVADRFGDNGLVGVAILGPLSDGIKEIDTLLMSCRVMGRGVESAFVAHLAEHARAQAATSLRGRYIPTPKNAPARDCYARLGFARAEEQPDGTEVWELDLGSQRVSVAPWLSVRPISDCPRAAA
jgi:FkbH-like protein